jgi:hypothetical protein
MFRDMDRGTRGRASTDLDGLIARARAQHGALEQQRLGAGRRALASE